MSIINFVKKTLRLLAKLFNIKIFEYGTISLTPAINDKAIFVSTSADVLYVWFYLQPIHNPYLGSYEESQNISMWHSRKVLETFGVLDPSLCYISEATPVPGGFEFKVNIITDCQLNW